MKIVKRDGKIVNYDSNKISDFCARKPDFSYVNKKTFTISFGGI